MLQHVLERCVESRCFHRVIGDGENRCKGQLRELVYRLAIIGRGLQPTTYNHQDSLHRPFDRGPRVCIHSYDACLRAGDKFDETTIIRHDARDFRMPTRETVSMQSHRSSVVTHFSAATQSNFCGTTAASLELTTCAFTRRQSTNSWRHARETGVPWQTPTSTTSPLHSSLQQDLPSPILCSSSLPNSPHTQPLALVRASLPVRGRCTVSQSNPVIRPPVEDLLSAVHVLVGPTRG